MNIKQKWRCCECCEIHDDEDDANYCCAPRVEQVYICPICDTANDTETEAHNCCDEDNPEKVGITAIQLEEHGQQRLIP